MRPRISCFDNFRYNLFAKNIEVGKCSMIWMPCVFLLSSPTLWVMSMSSMFPPPAGLRSRLSMTCTQAGHGEFTFTMRVLTLPRSPPLRQICVSTTDTTATHNLDLSKTWGPGLLCQQTRAPYCNTYGFTPVHQIRLCNCRGCLCQRACPMSMKDPPGARIRPVESLHYGKSRSASMMRRAGLQGPMSSHNF